jgi:hypothetical protein
MIQQPSSIARSPFEQWTPSLESRPPPGRCMNHRRSGLGSQDSRLPYRGRTSDPLGRGVTDCHAFEARHFPQLGSVSIPYLMKLCLDWVPSLCLARTLAPLSLRHSADLQFCGISLLSWVQNYPVVKVTRLVLASLAYLGAVFNERTSNQIPRTPVPARRQPSGARCLPCRQSRARDSKFFKIISLLLRQFDS